MTAKLSLVLSVIVNQCADEVFEILKKQLHPIALVNLDELDYTYPAPEK
jgi:hypothetical protein